MRRRLTFLAMGLAVTAVPLVHFGLGPVGKTVAAQDGNPDLVVVQPADDTPDSNGVYLELIQQKLKLLTPEELAREIQKLRNELTELESQRKLRDAERKLEELIEQHPQSRAAERARSMLNRGRERVNTPFGPDVRTFEAQDEFVPRRTPSSEYRIPNPPRRAVPQDDFEPPQQNDRFVPEPEPTRRRVPLPADDRDDSSDNTSRRVPLPDDVRLFRRKI